MEEEENERVMYRRMRGYVKDEEEEWEEENEKGV